MIVRWLGHAAVLAECADPPRRVLFDPYEPGGFGGRVAHAPIPGPVDLVVLTHHHADHAHLTPALGDPFVVDRSVRRGGLAFRTVPAWHDAQRGARMGLVRLVTLAADGCRVVHLGDLGVPPRPGQARRLGRPDVLFVPVGGTFTLDAAGAAETVRRLAPGVVVPIHYRTAGCRLALDGVGPFLARARAHGWPVHETDGSELTVTPAVPGAVSRVVVLSPAL